MKSYIPLADMMSGPAAADRLVCRRAGEAISLSRLRADVAHNTARLQRRVTSGASILLTCSDIYWFVVGLWASLHTGARVALPHNVQPRTVAEFQRHAALTIGDSNNCEAQDAFVCEPGDQDAQLKPLSPTGCQIDFYSSGSTGTPKRISKTLRQLEVEVRNLETSWGADMGPGAVLMTVSHLHIYGLTFGVLWPMAAGRPFDAEIHRIWETLVGRIETDSTIVSSPAHLSRIPDGLGARCPAMPRAVLSAGAPLPWRAAERTFQTFGCWPLEIYGSTETGGIASRSRSLEDPPWTPFAGVQVRPAPEGVLSIRSIYLNDDAWHDLDDLVEFDPDQRFRLKGRVDRVVKIEGKRVSLAEVEARILALDEFGDAAAIAIEEPATLLGVAAVLTGAGRRHLAELGSFRFSRQVNAKLRQHLEPAALPKRWRYVDRIPVNDQGKRVTSTILTLFEKSSAMLKTVPEVREVRRVDDALEIDMLISAELLYFQGHFPDFPVLPGIVQLEWAIAEARNHFGQSGSVLSIRNLKYRNLILPDAEVTLSLRYRADDGRVSFEYRGDDATYSSGRFTFAAA